MYDRTATPRSLWAFVDLEHSLFGWDADRGEASAQGFVRDALGPRRARVRFKTDRYPTVPMGPDTVRPYAGDVG